MTTVDRALPTERRRSDELAHAPLAPLERPRWSRGRLVGMHALRGYLVVAVILLVVKAVQLAAAH